MILCFTGSWGLGSMIRSGTIQVFSKNRDRLLTSEIAQDLLAALLAEPKVKPLLSHEHFSIDGTLLNAWASMTSLPRLARIVHSLSHYCCFRLYPSPPVTARSMRFSNEK